MKISIQTLLRLGVSGEPRTVTGGLLCYASIDTYT